MGDEANGQDGALLEIGARRSILDITTLRGLVSLPFLFLAFFFLGLSCHSMEYIRVSIWVGRRLAFGRSEKRHFATERDHGNRLRRVHPVYFSRLCLLIDGDSFLLRFLTRLPTLLTVKSPSLGLSFVNPLYH